ncbi:universal stress protein [Pseudonocardia sp. NPDC049154]|uniref:universal stress protein n=1 Tax=Pseudonocardia sp. NPDC049154 TaxID=3155501 RepID=UPI00340A1956
MSEPTPSPAPHRIQRSTPPSQAPQTHLVLGHDGRHRSDTALIVAADLARRLRGKLHVVHSIDLSDYPIDPDAADWEQQSQRALDEQYRRVAEMLAGCETGWSYHAWRGDPVELLTAVAEETDALMIVVGSRGEGPGKVIDRVFERSVSHGLIARQPRPVLVVPHRDNHSNQPLTARTKHGATSGKPQ